MAKKNTSRATIGSTKYQKEYINEKIDDLIREPMLPSEILLLHHKKRYTCFTSGYKYKINFCMRPISDISEDLRRLDEVSNYKIHSSKKQTQQNLINIWYGHPDFQRNA